MKLFVAILVLVAWVSAEEWTIKSPEQIHSIRCDCANENFPKFIICLTDKLGFFSADNGFDEVRFAKQFSKGGNDESRNKELAQNCVDQYPKDRRPQFEIIRDIIWCIAPSYIFKNTNDFINAFKPTTSC